MKQAIAVVVTALLLTACSGGIKTTQVAFGKKCAVQENGQVTYSYVWIYDNIWGKIPLVASSTTPEDLDGDGFDFDNNYIYVNTSEGWKEAPVATWISESSATIVPYMISDITESSFQINFASELLSQYFVHVIASR